MGRRHAGTHPVMDEPASLQSRGASAFHPGAVSGLLAAAKLQSRSGACGAGCHPGRAGAGSYEICKSVAVSAVPPEAPSGVWRLRAFGPDSALELRGLLVGLIRSQMERAILRHRSVDL